MVIQVLYVGWLGFTLRSTLRVEGNAEKLWFYYKFAGFYGCAPPTFVRFPGPTFTGSPPPPPSPRTRALCATQLLVLRTPPRCHHRSDRRALVQGAHGASAPARQPAPPCTDELPPPAQATIMLLLCDCFWYLAGAYFFFPSRARRIFDPLATSSSVGSGAAAGAALDEGSEFTYSTSRKPFSQYDQL